ncbi:hypothetical protein [Allosphingosinicella sp.]|jgi:hypothetical protein
MRNGCASAGMVPLGETVMRMGISLGGLLLLLLILYLLFGRG